ncbi:hypothetical protein H8E07_22295 [bacterium]|nr:hypothetical protein [bacterium]
MSRVIKIVLMLSLIAVPAAAQTGRWVTHDRDMGGTGSLLHAVGETTLVVTRTNTADLRFFDVINGTWVETSLPGWEEWIDVKAEGHLALAISADHAVAYNARTATAHVLAYDGELLLNYQLTPRFGCGRRLAYLVTDTTFYVFDADLDDWQAQPISLPGDYQNCRSVVWDDWAGMALHRPYGEMTPNYAYSLPHHAFAQTDHGAPYGPDTGALDHGFAETDNLTGSLGYVGYSAITNTFDHITLPAGWGLVDGRASDPQGKSERTVFAVSANVGGTPSHHYFWGYDTIRGAWSQDVVSYDYTEYSYFTAVMVGGRFAVSAYIVDDTDEMRYHVYSGLDGSIVTYAPGIYNGSNLHVTGGTVFIVTEAGNMAWGFDLPTGNSAVLPLGGDPIYGFWREAQDFVLFTVHASGGDTEHIHAYHGPTNAWSSVDVQQNTINYISGTHCYAYVWQDDHVDAAYFTGHHGAWVQTTFPWSMTRPWWRSNHLAALGTESGGCLYDARRHQLHMMDYEFDPNTCIGEAVFVGADDATQTAWGYSEITGAWSSAPIGDTPRVGAAVNHVGWVGDSWPTENLLAFNGFYGNWVPQSIGGHTSQTIEAGGRTILAIDLTTLHAFDPQAPALPIDDPGPNTLPPPRPAKLTLHPVHPNPFNPSTRFAFDLPRPGPFTLRVHDLRGRVVRTLAEGSIPAGSHTATWNGRDDDGRALPSGAYVIRLEAEGHAATRRATLLK